MDYRLEDLIDITLLQNLQDKLNLVYSFPSAIIDNEGKVLTAVAWQELCTKFHRIHPASEQACIKSDQYILAHLHEANPAVSYQCPHGLTDNATPIIIDGKHLGNFFTGQFFLEKPDLVFFKKQANLYGFDETAYLEAVEKVPVWTKEKLDLYLDFIKGFIEIIAGIGLNNLEIIESHKFIKESEDRHRTILQTAMDGFWLLNMQGHLIEVNEAYCRMSGYSAQELLTMRISDLEVAETVKNSEAHIQKVIAQGEDRFETRHRKKDGSIMDVEISVKYQTNDGGRLVAFLQDITARKQAEQENIKTKEYTEVLLKETQKQKSELELQNERLEGLLRISQYQPKSNQDFLDFALREAIGLTSSKLGYICFYNESSSQFTLNTWSKEVMHECTVLDPQTTYDLDKTGWWGEAVRQRKPIVINNYAEENPYAKGTPLGHVTLSKFLTIPVFIDKTIVAVVGVANKPDDYQQSDIRQLTLLMDTVWRISERELLFENLKDAKEHAEESDRLKSAFLANMSHEIRTPMNGILGFAQLLKEPNLSGDEQQEYIRIIEKSGARMLNIIHDIVDIAKIESGQMEVSLSETNINGQIEFIYDFFKPEAEQKEIQLFFKNHLSSKEAMIHTDREKIYAILTNLVKNAIKNTRKGSVEFGYEKKESDLEFFVKDTGGGIPRERQQAIFQRFIQADMSNKRAHDGAGLGLSIAKAYVEMLGGRIWVESEFGNGATFYFTIPYNTEYGEIRTSKIIINKEHNSPPVKKLKILIVEDDEDSQRLMSLMVKKVGKELLMCSNGYEAVEVCRNHPDLDLIMLDIKLPGISGYEVAGNIRQFNSGVIIIAQTAFAISGDREKALEAGCNDYITKPIKENVLLALIQKHVDP
jgi:PAS domain S-box-containing protein